MDQSKIEQILLESQAAIKYLKIRIGKLEKEVLDLKSQKEKEEGNVE